MLTLRSLSLVPILVLSAHAQIINGHDLSKMRQITAPPLTPYQHAYIQNRHRSAPLDGANHKSGLSPMPSYTTGHSSWGGYVLYFDPATTYDSVSVVAGDFTIPSYSCTSTFTSASAWVGIGNVAQAGAILDCSGSSPYMFSIIDINNGSQTNDTWSEQLYAGDEISVMISGPVSSVFTFDVYHFYGPYSSTGFTTYTHRNTQLICYTCGNTSAEWILENSAGSDFTDVGTLNFNDAFLSTTYWGIAMTPAQVVDAESTAPPVIYQYANWVYPSGPALSSIGAWDDTYRFPSTAGSVSSYFPWEMYPWGATWYNVGPSFPFAITWLQAH